MANALQSLLRDNYAGIAKDLLGSFVEVLQVGRAHSSGDLDNLLIILVVALRTAEDRRIAGVRLEQVMSGELESYPSLNTNVRSIAESTGIPKETVRRKVAALIEGGWISRESHNLALTTQASRMLTPVREELFQLAARSHQIITALSEAQGDPER